MLLVCLSCTEKDFHVNSNRLSISLSNFHSVFGGEVFFLIIFQAKSVEIFDPKETFLNNLPDESYLFRRVDYLSVSRSRNEAVDYAIEKKYNRLIFHDSSLIYTLRFIRWLSKQPPEQLVSTSWVFSNKIVSSNVLSSARTVCFDPFKDIFVWTYVFPLRGTFPKFDERFGPGENSIFTSGEDFLFLRQFFKMFPNEKSFVRFSGEGVMHPPRPDDYSKHLTYAYGQGKIHQVFLLEERSVNAIWRCCLFFGNALFRMILLKKNSFNIAKLRFKGFFDSSVKV